MLNQSFRNAAPRRLGTAFIGMLSLLLALGIQTANAQYSSVTITEVETIATCDIASWKVKFKVDNPSPTGGWIVQYLSFSGDVYDCDGKRLGWDPTAYYEAWPVAANADTTSDQWPTAGGAMWNDNYWVGPLHDTYGSATWNGTIGFVANPPGGGSPDTNTPNTWTQTGIPMSGGLWATYTKPSFWDALVASGNTKSHNATVSWNCCGTEKDSVVWTDKCIGVCDEPQDTIIEDTTIIIDDTVKEDELNRDPKDRKEQVGKMIQGSRFPSMPSSGSSPGDQAALKGFEFEAYPVPFEDKLNLVLSVDPGEELSIRVINLNGQVLYEVQKSYEARIELDLADLPRGIYSIHVQGTSSGLDFSRNIVK